MNLHTTPSLRHNEAPRPCPGVWYPITQSGIKLQSLTISDSALDGLEDLLVYGRQQLFNATSKITSFRYIHEFVDRYPVALQLVEEMLNSAKNLAEFELTLAGAFHNSALVSDPSLGRSLLLTNDFSNLTSLKITTS